jgi:DNA-binding response OmpR family regulator
MRELLARMRAVMRRAGGGLQVPVTRGRHPRAYRFDGWSLNLNTRRLTAPDNRQVALTNAEFNLLVVFLATPAGIITREQLLERTRAFDDVYDRAIDVQILRLRRKLEADPKNPRLLKTERGVGYFFDAEIETIWE